MYRDSIIKFLLFFTLISIYSGAIFSQDTLSSDKKFAFATGVLMPSVLRTSTSNTGSKGLIGDMYGEAVASYDLDMGSIKLRPSFGITLLNPKNVDGEAKTQFMNITLPVVFGIGGSTTLGIGPGLSIYKQSGTGRLIILNNGGGTATFRVPGKTISTKIFTIEVIITARASDLIFFDFGSYIPGLLSSKRAFNAFVRLRWKAF